MSLALYAHPFSSYCQKALIAFYENNIRFELKMLAPDQPINGAVFAEVWPLQKMPVLVDHGAAVMESSIIIEYLQLHHPGPVRLIPSAAPAALDVRFMDRCFDSYVMSPMQTMVGDYLRPADSRDAFGVTAAKRLLDSAYAWLDGELCDRPWAAGETFTLADCAAAPALFYADWVHEIPAQYTALRAYRSRLLQRPSIARVVDEARPYRPLFPLRVPERD